MHGLINRSIQCFMRDTYGPEFWTTLTGAAGLEFDSFEALLDYDDRLTDQILDAASLRLRKPVDALLEDLGTYLIWNAGSGGVRRLLRFGGVGFVDFLHSLDDLEDRVGLALPDFKMPRIGVEDHGAGRFAVLFEFEQSRFANVLLGALRAMADDYGALVVLDHHAVDGRSARIGVELLEEGYSAGREFVLGAPVARHG